MSKFLLLIAASLFLSIALSGWYFIYRSGRNDILVSESGVPWIRIDYQLSAAARPIKYQTALFSTSFNLAYVPSVVTLRLKAFRNARLKINSKTVPIPNSDFPLWKVSRELDIAPWLRSGKNKITIEVVNSRGPPALLAYSRELGLQTGRQWVASENDKPFINAVPISIKPKLDQHGEFPTSLKAMSRIFVYLLAFFIVGLVGYAWVKAKNIKITPGQVRWAMLVVWIVLGANNLFKIPIYFGMDASDHYNYIIYILKSGALPLATNGAQMFQAPLFYVLEALLALVVSIFASPENVLFALRVIPLACGLVQIELAYRSCCLVFRKRSDLQIVGTVIGGFLPMSFYMSQFVSNEPLAASLMALLIYFCFYYLIHGFRNDAIKSSAILAVLFSASLLSKVSVVLLLPIVLALIAFVSWRSQRRVEVAIKPLGIFLLITCLLTGWYFLRNFYHLGKPFIGGWELPSHEWWQDPGYLTLSNLLTFGRVLVQPIYSSIFGFWDALYSSFWLDGNLSGQAKGSPPWNFEFMNSLAILSLPLVLLMFYGAFRGLKTLSGEHKQVFILAITCILIFVTAIFYLYVKLSVYSTVKASYMLGLTPCFAILAASGYESLPKVGWWPAVASGYITCWAVTAYTAFFVLYGPSFPV